MRSLTSLLIATLLATGCSANRTTTPPDEAPTEGATTADTSEEGAPEASAGAAPAEDAEPGGDAAAAESCVADVAAHAKARFTEKVGDILSADNIEERFVVDDFEDLDGDGEPDQKVILYAYAYNTEVLIYLSNSGCPILAGEFMATSFEPLETKHAGVRDIKSWTKGGCMGLEGDLVLYHFDAEAKRYSSAESIGCACKAECDCSASPDRDPRCPVYDG